MAETNTLALLLPLTTRALYDALLVVQTAWIAAAQSGRYFSPGMGTYVRGIQAAESVRYPDGGNPLAGSVVNMAAHVQAIEEGTAGFHLPSVIKWAESRAAKRSTTGRYYIRVPLRHSVPRTGAGVTSYARRTMMPKQVYQVARTLQPGQRTTAGPTRGRAFHVRDLLPYAPRYAANVRPGYQHASVHEGMVKRVAVGHSQYMTWRTMTQDSPGWNVAARPGTHIAAAVARETVPALLAAIGNATAADIASLLRVSLGGK